MGDVLMLIPLGRGVEGPDFYRLHSVAIHQLPHDFVRIGVEIVSQAEACVVNPDFRIGLASQQPVHGDPESLSKQVPKSEVDRAHHSHFSAPGDLKIKGSVKVGPNSIDVAGVPSEQLRGDGGVHDGGLRLVAWISLADALLAAFCLNPNPDPIGIPRRVFGVFPVGCVNALDQQGRHLACAGALFFEKRNRSQRRLKR